MSRSNDGLPMLPPWLADTEVTGVGQTNFRTYEPPPVENLPQDDVIPETPEPANGFFNRRGRGDNRSESDGDKKKGKGWFRNKGKPEPSLEERVGELLPSNNGPRPSQRNNWAEGTAQWSVQQPPADPSVADRPAQSGPIPDAFPQAGANVPPAHIPPVDPYSAPGTADQPPLTQAPDGRPAPGPHWGPDGQQAPNGMGLPPAPPQQQFAAPPADIPAPPQAPDRPNAPAVEPAAGESASAAASAFQAPVSERPGLPVRNPSEPAPEFGRLRPHHPIPPHPTPSDESAGAAPSNTPTAGDFRPPPPPLPDPPPAAEAPVAQQPPHRLPDLPPAPNEESSRADTEAPAPDAGPPAPRPQSDSPAPHGSGAHPVTSAPTADPVAPWQAPESAPAPAPQHAPGPQWQAPEQPPVRQSGAQHPIAQPGPATPPPGTPAQHGGPPIPPANPGPHPNQPPAQQWQNPAPPAHQAPQHGSGTAWQQPGPPQGGQWQNPQVPQQPPQQQFGPNGPTLDNVSVRRAKKPAGNGWRKVVHHASGGKINPGMSAEERRMLELVARIRQPVRGDYRIAVLSLKGGVGKTTTTIGLGSTFASIRGDRVIAVDANPDFGTLSQRVPLQTRSTVRDLLLDPAIQRYSDVRRHTSQATSRLEVLASERDPAASEAFNEDEYRAVARILQRFYNIILTDCGTGLMHSAMAGVLQLAHSLVLISPTAIDGAQSASATLDWLSLHGYHHLVQNAVVVINSPRDGTPNIDVQQLRQYFLSRCRAVHMVPFDPHMSEGAEIDLARLKKETKRAYVELAATVADDFGRSYGPQPGGGVG